MLAPLPQKHAAKSPTLLRHLAGRYMGAKLLEISG